MELRHFAAGVIEGATLERKLLAPPNWLSDDEPGYPLLYAEPMRPHGLEIVRQGKYRVPKSGGWSDPGQRPRILHGLANHELQAAELFAWALLAFPAAPAAFRRGLLSILVDEQRHCRMYVDRLEALGKRFGDYPVSGHFWTRIADIQTPLQFVCTFGMTFENANLDFAQEHIRAAKAAGEDATADVLGVVHADEVRHVAFAWHWFREFKDPDQPEWDAYCANVAPPNGPDRARGADFDRAAREAAGLSPDFIDSLERTRPTAPGGAPR